jgi:hypothetical protein
VRRREYFWSLYNRSDKKQIDDMRTDQIEAIYEAVGPSRHSDFMIWKDGLNEWKLLSEFPLLLMSLRQTSEITQPVPNPELLEMPDVNDVKDAKDAKEKKPAFQASLPKKALAPSSATTVIAKTADLVPSTTGSISEDTQDKTDDSIHLALETGSTAEDRGDGRYQKRFTVRIMAGDKIFQTSTLNISVKGMKIRDALPLGLPRYFNVELMAAGRVIPFVCSEVKGLDGSPSNRLKIEVNDHVNVLQTLLLVA